MITVPLLKCHGSGNDFLLVDEYQQSLIAEEHKASFSHQICHRNLGFGADGVLFILPATRADLTMRMFNPDGSEAQMCGNGLRCAARYYCETYNKTEDVTIATPKAKLQCIKDTTRENVVFYRTQIGPVSMDSTTLPTKQNHPVEDQVIHELDDKIRWYGLSITNPHLVAIVDVSLQARIESLGAKANENELFPDGINCSLISLIDDGSIFVSTYERGAKLTNSCGTAMAASAFVTVFSGKCPANTIITIHNSGGRAFAESSGITGDMVWLSGNATFVYKTECYYNEQNGKLASDVGAYQQLLENNKKHPSISR